MGIILQVDVFLWGRRENSFQSRFFREEKKESDEQSNSILKSRCFDLILLKSVSELFLFIRILMFPCFFFEPKERLEKRVVGFV
ncbi:hypothetical protein A0128_05245 [Leptospira tipperaryensis]|uniref:Uncharacterized protein n=1 Tax=Leptospira tipperaryensis TaxID=2564040 RepID=A0A1D7UUT6_9LEPT|nr:hypothetical protein A0128_05245 [Leptospira tipperaryensis]